MADTKDDSPSGRVSLSNSTAAGPVEGKDEAGSGERKPGQPRLEISTSRQFSNWLAEAHASLAFTTYQAGKLFFVGLQDNGSISVFERTLPRCMGLCRSGNSLWVSSLFQLHRFENVLEAGKLHNGYDRLYLPQVSYITGDLDVHDIAIDGQGRPIFVNTLFSCLSTTSETHSFRPLWQPPFISKLAAQDRAHLNGLAAVGGKPRYVTAVSESDATDGWREFREDGGVVIDVETNQVVCRGLSMPHSPRMHQGRLWDHNSGTGFFGSVNLETGAFEPLTFCAGYLRGLDFIGDYAVVGTSKSRKNRTFGGLELDANLTRRKAEARCALLVIDLRTGDIVHWLRLEGVVEELYDVSFLPGAKRPMAIGFQTDEIRRVIAVQPGS